MNKKELKDLYIKKCLSSNKIAQKFSCSEHKINYWLNKFKIKKRTISEAIYKINNPKGDPFSFSTPNDIKTNFLFGLGLGLFWGEGTKKSSHSVRLCNSDPLLVKKYIEFLVKIYEIDKSKLKFQLQIYNESKLNESVMFWKKNLLIKTSQFYKTTILKKRGAGNYINKMEHGTIIVCFNNIKLRNLIYSQIVNIGNI